MSILAPNASGKDMLRGDLNSKVVNLCERAPPACGIELFPKAADLDEGRTDTLRSAWMTATFLPVLMIDLPLPCRS